MNKRSVAAAILAVILLGALALYGYRRWGGSGSSPRDELLAQMPTDASAILFLDLDGLRQSPFLRNSTNGRRSRKPIRTTRNFCNPPDSIMKPI